MKGNNPRSILTFLWGTKCKPWHITNSIMDGWIFSSFCYFYLLLIFSPFSTQHPNLLTAQRCCFNSCWAVRGFPYNGRLAGPTGRVTESLIPVLPAARSFLRFLRACPSFIKFSWGAPYGPVCWLPLSAAEGSILGPGSMLVQLTCSPSV